MFAGSPKKLLAERTSGSADGGDSLLQFFQRRLRGLSLTSGQRDLVAGLLNGHTNKQLAKSFGISEQS